jgi:probable F420-dependent oxidoreductase
MGVPVQIGVVLPRGSTSHQPVQIVAQTAEALDYDCVWSTEHIAVPLSFESRYPFSDDDQPPWPTDAKWFEGMVVLGFVAGVTERIRIGTAVIPLFNRDPLSLAKQAATLDCLSGGRLELGLGAGWLVEEAEVLGHPSDHRGKRLDEAIDILRKAWSEHPVEHQGEHYAFPPVAVSPKPPQGRDLPIWIGGLSPIALRTATDRATGTILWNQPPAVVAEVGAKLRAVRPDVQIAAGIYAKRDVAEAAEEAIALREAGADNILLLLPSRPARAVGYLAGFAAEHMQALRDAQPAAGAATPA